MKHLSISVASKDDLPKILSLQKKAYVSEAVIYNDFNIPPLHQSLSEIEEEFENHIFLKAEDQCNLVGSVRAFGKDNVCFIGKLIVDKTEQNRGLGQKLLVGIESQFPAVAEYQLFTGQKSEKNLYLYKKLGYEVTDHKKISHSLTIVTLKKNNILV